MCIYKTICIYPEHEKRFCMETSGKYFFSSEQNRISEIQFHCSHFNWRWGQSCCNGFATRTNAHPTAYKQVSPSNHCKSMPFASLNVSDLLQRPSDIEFSIFTSQRLRKWNNLFNDRRLAFIMKLHRFSIIFDERNHRASTNDISSVHRNGLNERKSLVLRFLIFGRLLDQDID